MTHKCAARCAAKHYGFSGAFRSIAAVPTLAELLNPRTQDQREAQLLALLNSVGFPVSDWYVGSVGRTIQKMVAFGLVDLDALIPQIAAGGFLGPFTVGGKTYPSRPWLELLAKELFGVQFAPATYTRQRCSLWCDPGAGPYVIGSIGQLTAISRFGRRYTNTTLGTVVAGVDGDPTTTPFEFQAESPGSVYNGDITGTIVELVTPLPGLHISNDRQDYGGCDPDGRATRTGSSTGTVRTFGTPTVAHRYRLTVLVAGQKAAAVGALDIDGTVTTLAPLGASYTAPDGVVLGFYDGGQNPSFLRGDYFEWTTLASPIVNPGVEAESDDSIRARCRGRWPSLSDIPVEDRYVAWIRQASLDAGFGITKITASPSVLMAGYVDIRVATDAGSALPDVVTALQAYLDLRDGITDHATVATAAPLPIAAGGTVTVRQGAVAAVKLAAKAGWEEYVASLPIGGSTPEGVVRLAELQQAIMDAGALDVTGLTLNGVAGNQALVPTEVALVDNSIDTALTWIEVA